MINRPFTMAQLIQIQMGIATLVIVVVTLMVLYAGILLAVLGVKVGWT